MTTELLEAVEMLEKEKGISKDALFDAVEAALLTASKNHFGKSDNVKVVIDHETGEYRLYQILQVVAEDDFVDPQEEITPEQLMAKYNIERKVGDEFLREFESTSFGRIASQNAKNVILQKIREEERKTVYEKFASKEHEVVTGVIQRKNGRSITINLGSADAILTEKEQVSSENYIQGRRLKVYIVEVKNTTKGPRILASRTHPELVKKLFEAEVAEIQNGIVEVMAIAREAGSRTKMAVWSNDENVDPIGACVGVNGIRVNAVVDELFGEKIDIINWSDEPAILIENAISPAKVICVLADPDEKEATVVVRDDQLSLAIGKVGQNARLAARLTGFKIDIKSESQARESGLFDEIGYIDDYAEEETEEIVEYEEVYEYEDGELADGYTALPDDKDVEYEVVEEEAEEDGEEETEEVEEEETGEDEQ